jgi:hypothetical protein
MCVSCQAKRQERIRVGMAGMNKARISIWLDGKQHIFEVKLDDPDTGLQRLRKLHTVATRQWDQYLRRQAVKGAEAIIMKQPKQSRGN